jgi:hypothetical protein
MKAEIIYKDGWMLTFPKTGNSPLLFIEWIAYYNASQCPIHKIIDGEIISVRLNGTKQSVYESALKYINDNL